MDHALSDSSAQLVLAPIHVDDTADAYAADDADSEYNEKDGNTPVWRFSACEVAHGHDIISIFIFGAVSSVARVAGNARRALRVLLGAVLRAARNTLIGGVTVCASAARALAAAKEWKFHAFFRGVALGLAVLGADHSRGFLVTAVTLTRVPRGAVFLRFSPPDVVRDARVGVGAAAAHARDAARGRGRSGWRHRRVFAIAWCVGAFCEGPVFVCASVRVAAELTASRSMA